MPPAPHVHPLASPCPAKACGRNSRVREMLIKAIPFDEVAISDAIDKKFL
jgi:hypothetical protein